jgi:hypothetical protein
VSRHWSGSLFLRQGSAFAVVIFITACPASIVLCDPVRLSALRQAVHFVAVDGSDSGPGTMARPWATINHAAEQAQAGDTIVVRGGSYVLPAQVRPRNSGRSDAWITYVAYPGENPIFDAQQISYESLHQGDLDNGAFQIENVSYIRVANLKLINSHDAGFTVRDSSNIDLITNSTNGTYSSGIAVWDTNHEGKRTQKIRILGNTITRATTWDLAPADKPKPQEQPQEALSIGGAVDFKVAYNHVYDSEKEGIDIKETSKQGSVNHNFVDNLDRQGIYIDAWFGELDNIEVFSNVVERCRGAGIALSVENGRSLHKVGVHNNLVFDNAGTGLFFSRWGVDNPRWNIQIHNNVFYHNGYGAPRAGQNYYWITGGLYLYSTNLHDISIKNNIFSENDGFQIGYSEAFLSGSQLWESMARQKNILIEGNVIDGRNVMDLPIETGGDPPDGIKIYAVNGSYAIFGNPLFKDPAGQDFGLRGGSPAMRNRVAAGAYAPGAKARRWWKRDFPPKIVGIRFARSTTENDIISVRLPAPYANSKQ